MKIHVGADPELFLVDGAMKFISSIDKIGGTKENPFAIREDGCAVQEDNVAVEFNIPPSTDVNSFIEAINFNLDYLKKRAEGMNLALAIKASAIFSDDQLADPRALEFGCEPDYNAWTRRINPRPKATNQALRSAGGHVHVGVDEKLDKIQLVRAMDVFLGVPSLEFDKDTARRELYGKAGAFRPKSYGVEYRTLSNWWIADDTSKKWVFDNTIRAVNFVADGGIVPDTDAARIQACINESNHDLMTEIKADYGV